MPTLIRIHPPSLLRRLITAHRSRRTHRRAIQELRSLSDWQLADIGIAREQIADVVAAIAARGGCHPRASVTLIDVADNTTESPSSDPRRVSKFAA